MTSDPNYQIKAQAKMDAYRRVNTKYVEMFANDSARQRAAYFTQIAERADKHFEQRAADDIYGQSFDAHEAHYARIQAENAAAQIEAEPKRETSFVARGIKFRSTSNRQFILVHVDAERQRATVVRRSDSYDVIARERARQITPSSYVVINQITGEEV